MDTLAMSFANKYANRLNLGAVGLATPRLM